MTYHFDDKPIPFTTLTEALVFWADERPDALALTAGTQELTYQQLSDHVSRCMQRLREDGVGAGDRVVIVGHNTIAWVVHYLAILSLGAVVAPANNRLNPGQFADQADLLETALVLADDDHRAITELTVRRVGELSLDYSSHTRCPFEPLDEATPALISFTSGTTGKPKGATLSQGALARASWHFVQVMKTTSDDSTLVMVPMFHNTGFVDQFGHMLLVGGRTDLLARFRTADAIKALQQREVTYLAAVPSIHRLVMLADGAYEALSSIRALLYGGSPMPATWINEFIERWPSMRLYHGYGMTEYGSAVSFLPNEFAETRGESIGFAVPGTRIRIVRDDGSEARPGQVGELWVKGPTMMSGYWKQPELTAAKIHEGWLRTGDLARLDNDFYYLEGRVDDVINRGGEKVLPAHVESMLARLSAVAESCVFGVPDPILQNRVWAVVEEKSGVTLDAEAARATLSTQLPDYAVPERIFVRVELPRTGSGKVDRRAIAREFAELIDKGALSVR